MYHLLKVWIILFISILYNKPNALGANTRGRRLDTLTSTSLEIPDRVQGISSSATFEFTLASTFPINGKVRMTFPDTFSAVPGLLDSATVGTVTGIGGTKSISLNGLIATISFSGNENINQGTIVRVAIENIVIPPSSSTLDSYTVETLSAAEAQIDTADLQQPETFLPAPISSFSTTPASFEQGVTGEVSVAFTTSSALLPDGKIEIDFADNFAAVSATTAISSDTGNGVYPDGSFTISVSVIARRVTITRNNDGSSTAAGTIAFKLSGITNPSGPLTFAPATISIMTRNNYALESGSAPSITIYPSPGTISDFSATPASITEGDTGEVSIVATITNAIPANGKLEVEFDSNFQSISGSSVISSDVANGVYPDGTFTISVSSRTVTITRNNDGVDTSAGTIAFKLSGVTNPASPLTFVPATIRVLAVNDYVLDSGTASAITIQPTASTFSSFTATPESLTAGSVSDVSLVAVLANALPADAVIEVDFANNFFAVSGSTAISPDTDNGVFPDGTFSIVVSGKKVTITRNNDGASTLAGTIAFKLSGITNPVIPESFSSAIMSIKSSGGYLRESGSASSITILPGLLSSASVVPSSDTAGATVTLTISMVNSNPIPADGKVILKLASSFYSAITSTTLLSHSFTGGVSVLFDTNEVTFVRNGDGSTLPAAQTISLVLENLVLPSSTNSGTFPELYSTTTADVKIDETATSISGFAINTVGVILSSNVLVCSEAGPPKTYSIVLAAEPTASVTINLSKNADNTVMTLSVSSITFTTGNWNVAQDITLMVPDDYANEAATTVEVTHTLSSSDARYSATPNFSPSNVVTAQIYDNDTPFILITSSTQSLVENVKTGTYSIELGTQPSAGVTISLDNSGAVGRVGISATQIDFTTSNWNVAQTITLTATVDAIAHDELTYSIEHSATSSDPKYDSSGANFVSSSSVTVRVKDDDYSAIELSKSHLHLSEDASTTSSYTVVLASEPVANVVVTIDNSANAGRATLSASPITFTTADWNIPQTITVSIVSDDVDQAALEYSIVHSAASTDTRYDTGSTFLPSSSVVVSIKDDDYSSVVLSVGYVYITEGSTSTYTLVLNSEPTATVTVALTPTSRLTLSSVSVEFTTANWNSPQSITITSVLDDLAHSNLIDSQSITHVVSSSDPFYNPSPIGPTNPLLVDLVDLNRVGIILSQTVFVCSEDGPSDDYTIVLNSEPTAEVTINLSKDQDDSVITISPSSVVFNAGNWNVAQTITMALPGDSELESSIPVQISHAVVTTDVLYDAAPNFMPTSTVSVTVIDNDFPYVQISDMVAYVYENLRNDSYTVVLGSKPTATVTITIDNSNSNGQVSVDPTVLVFEPENWSDSQTVDIYAPVDSIAHENFNYQLTHSISSTDSAYNTNAVFSSGTASTIYFVGYQTASVILTKSRLYLSEEEPTTATYDIVLSSKPTASATVTISNAGSAGRVSISPSSIEFTTSNWNVARTVTLTVVANDIVDGELTYNLEHSVSSSDTMYNAGDAFFTPSNLIAVVVQDNDNAGVLLSAAYFYVMEGASDNYDIVLTSEPSQSVSITLTPSSGVTLSTSTVTFTTGNWNVAQNVVLTALNDDVAYTTVQSETITHVVSSTDTTYASASVLPKSVIDVSLYTTNAPGISISVPHLYLTESEATSYSVVLLSKPFDTVTIAISQSDSLDELTISPVSLTFTAGVWNVAQTVSVTAKDTYVATGTEPLLMDIEHAATSTDSAYNGLATAFSPAEGKVAVTLYDNDIDCMNECSAGDYSITFNDNAVCIPCPAGFYCDGGCAAPTPCPKGTASAASGAALSSTCVACLPGYNAPSEGTTICSQCSAGYQCADATANAVACATQTYSSAGSITCTDCTAGYSCATPNVAPVECSIGYYALARSTECTPCPAGSKCPSTTALPEACATGTYSLGTTNACTECPAGSSCFNQTIASKVCSEGSYSTGGSEFCLLCPAGYECPSSSSSPIPCAESLYSVERDSICHACPAGYQCADQTILPIACLAGTYSVGNAITCTTCPAGFQCPDTLNAPIACPSGYYSEAGAQTCLPCTAGHFCALANQLPQPCAAGAYSAAGTSSCTDCEAMFSCADASVDPVPCESGEYSLTKEISCNPCPPGYACNTIGSLILCESGFYSIESQMTCEPCPKGKHCPTTTTLPVDCISGQYSPAEATSCTDCQAGYACLSPELDPDLCPDGTYSLNLATSCTTVPAGAFSAASHLAPTACPLGTYSLGAATSCSDCPPGYGCEHPENPPEACLPGTYSPGGQDCTTCSAGHYCPSSDHTKQIACGAGTYALAGAFECTPCPAAKECPYTTQDLERNCTAGTFSVGGQDLCTPCPAGWKCPHTDGSGNVQCELGTFSTGSAEDCTACSTGHYCPNTDQPNQLPCATGTYSLGGQSICTDCIAGYACPDTHTDNRVACIPGTYSIGTQEACTPCPAGFTCPNTDSSDKVACEAGWYSLAGDQLCTQCTAGHSCQNQSTVPDPCDNGYYSGLGAAVCEACPAGHQCADAALDPQPCPIGYWSAGGSMTCLECDPGYRCSVASTQPSPPEDACPMGGYCNPPSTFYSCPEGTFGDVTAGISIDHACQVCPEGYFCTAGSTPSTMEICPTGHYCPEGTQRGSSYPCLAGKYNDLTGSISSGACQDCPEGYYCESGTSQPAPCPPGYYCPLQTTSAFANPCPAGTYSGVSMITTDAQCKTCELGSYCPEGSINPVNCPAGTYNPNQGGAGLHECIACLEGWTCPNVGQFQVTDGCEQGHYCPPSTVSSTAYPCPAGTFTDSTDLIRSLDCSVCPERFACLQGTGGPQQPPVACAAGHYCPDGTQYASQYECPPGTWSDSTSLASSDECTICEEGKYCIGGQTQISGDCEAGYYCPQGSSSSQEIPCPKGYYSAATNIYELLQCIECPAGSYCPEASTQSFLCPTGTYSPFNKTEGPGPGTAPDCIECTAGYYCEEGSENPEECGLGQHSAAGSSSCDQCPAGHYCATTTSTTATTMVGGADWGLSNSLSGQCFNGTYCPAGHSRVPTLELDACPKGYYCPTATPSPIPCPAGTYNEMNGQDELDDCLATPAGYYSIQAAEEPTGECQPGFYCPERSTSDTQFPCPRRYYRNETKGTSESDCSLCVSGSYCVEGTSDPLPCPKGYYCNTGVAEPEACPISTFGDEEGLKRYEECRECLPGMYCDGTGLTYPRGQCDPGYYCSNGSDTSAPLATGSLGEQSGIGGPCTRGSYCPLGSSQPEPCSAGTFNNYTGSASVEDCSPCPSGEYCQGVGNALPTGICDPGFFCNGSASTSTQYDAQPGYYSLAGATTQTPCLPGTFNAQVQQSECSECPERYYCEGIATVDPVDCPAGMYCPSSTSTPSRCPSGTYSGVTGLALESECIQCEAGHYCASNGLTEPTGDCLAGYYCTRGSPFANPNEEAFGSLCPKGNYCVEGSSSGTPCPRGTYMPNLQATSLSSCMACTEGMYCNDTALLEPTGFCEEGYYCTLSAETATPIDGVTGNICPAGRYCPEGSPVPIKCAAGNYTDTAGNFECKVCPERNYCDGDDTSTYKICPAGSYCPTGSDTPFPCVVGTYSNITGLRDVDECLPCTGGYYCETPGLTAPTGICDAGYVCEAGAGTAYGGRSGVSNVLCPRGYYCEAGTFNPVACPKGTYSNISQLTQEADCEDCPEGSYCETEGLNAPTGLCDAGFMCKLRVEEPRPLLGVYTMNEVEYGGDLCPQGNYCEEGTSDPAPCNPGTYGNATGLAECATCPSGYYCPIGTVSFTDFPCLAGYYCPEGTMTSAEFPCPPGSYNPNTQSKTLDECVLAPGGMYADNYAQTAVSGLCESGYYCITGATSATPDDGPTGGRCKSGTNCPEGTARPIACEPGSYCASSDTEITGPCLAGFYCIQGSYTNTPTGQTNSEGSIGDECPEGHYCPEGSSNPIPCPAGTYSNVKRNTEVSDCLPCKPGFVCPSTGTVEPTELCSETFYCNGGNSDSVEKCPKGHFCQEGSATPTSCPPGTFTNETGTVTCEACSERYYCDGGTSEPIPCPPGFYCPMGTTRHDAFPCLPGTFSNRTELASAEECSPCPASKFCNGIVPTDAPSGDCSPGYYCAGGATTSRPEFPSQGGQCDPGYVCLGGASVSNPFDGVTGYPAPPGFYSETGATIQIGCSAGTYNPLYSQSECTTCEMGKLCTANATAPSVCPERFYCPRGTAAPILCPNGTYGATTSLEMAMQCSPCTPGHFCTDGAITGACSRGYFCRSFNSDPQPEAVSNSSWELLRGGPCPIGHYCPEGTVDPVPCPDTTSRLDRYGASADDCGPCPQESNCADGTLTKICDRGHYCPYADGAIPCPRGTYNAEYGKYKVEDCLPCAAGKFCDREGIVDPTNMTAVPGTFTLQGATNLTLCAAGSFRREASGESQADCFACPAGSYCPPGSREPIPCEASFYCPTSSGNTTVCPAGHHCAFNSTSPVPCDAGYYCPTGSAVPLECYQGVYCPSMSSAPIPCPLGYRGRNTSLTGVYDTLTASCIGCERGTYGSDPLRLECAPGLGGYVYKAEAKSAKPSSLEEDNGYRCPKGYYCPESSFQENPCPVGTFNPNFNANNISFCTPCAKDNYQFLEGQESCKPCSTSATAAKGSSVCTCKGNHRAFQMTDGYCICQPGYEFIDVDGNRRSDEDGEVDCQPFVYDRCSEGEIRSDSGSCIALTQINCENACGKNQTGKVVSGVGLCECDEQEDLDSICDENCRRTSDIVQVDPLTGALVVVNPLTGEKSPAMVNDSSIINAARCGGELAGYDGRGCTMQSIIVNEDGFKGSYQPTIGEAGRRRRLQSEESGISNPMVCILKGDGLVFSLSGGTDSYPVYIKDSMLNTNPQFDYGAFRRLAEKAKTSTIITTFAFSFDSSGVYVFANNLNLEAKTIVVVMEDGTSCPTEGAIVPMNEKNLIAVNAKRSSDIILAPNWNLIGGLLLGLLGMVAAIIGGLYYFRRRTWASRNSGKASFRKKGRKAQVSSLHTKGSVIKTRDINNIAIDDLSALEMQSPANNRGMDLDRWDDDDLDVRELVERLQHHHDTVERSFLTQKSEAGKVIEALHSKANELKQLLATAIVQKSGSDTADSKTAALVRHMASDVIGRSEFESTEISLQKQLKSDLDMLALLIDQDTKELTARVFEELEAGTESQWIQSCQKLVHVINERIAEDNNSSAICGLIYQEKSRKEIESAVFQAHDSITKSALPKDFVPEREALHKGDNLHDKYVATYEEHIVKFSKTATNISTNLNKLQEAFVYDGIAIREKQNPAMTKQFTQKFGKKLAQLLKELNTVTNKVSRKIQEANQKTLSEHDYKQERRDRFLKKLRLFEQQHCSQATVSSDVMQQLQKLLPNMDLGVSGAPVPKLKLDPEMERIQSTLLDPSASMTERHEAEQEWLQGREATLANMELAELQEQLEKEIAEHEQGDKERVDQLRSDFISELEDNPALSEEERAAMLDDFNLDLAQLQESLVLERKKHEEDLRNRIAKRALQRERKQRQKHEDEFEEENLLHRQEEEAEVLEEHFENLLESNERQLEEEYARDLAKLDDEYQRANSKAIGERIQSRVVEEEVAETEEETIRLINDKHRTGLKDKTNAIELDARRQKKNLKDRLAQKRLNQKKLLEKGTIAPAEFDSTLKQLAAEESQEIKKIEENLQQRKLEVSHVAEKELDEAKEATRDAIEATVSETKNDTESLIESTRNEHDAQLGELKENLKLERQSKEELLRKRLANRKKKLNEEKLADCDREVKLKEAEEYEKEEARKLAQELENRERELLEKEHEKQRTELEEITKKQALNASLKAEKATIEAKHTEEELKRMADDHQQEFSRLEETLNAEKSKQLGNLQDRIAKRREAKKKQMEAEGAQQAEMERMEQDMAQEEAQEKLRIQEESENKAEASLKAERQRQDHERKLAETKAKQAAIEAAAAAAAAKATEALHENELERVTEEFSSMTEKQNAVVEAEYKSKKSKLNERIQARKKAAKAALEAKRLEEEELLAQKQQEEAMSLQVRLEESVMEEQWKAEVEKESHNAVPTSEELNLENQQQKEREELEARQEQEARRLAKEQEIEAQVSLESEAAREAAEAEKELASRRKQMEEKLAETGANMAKEELDRIKQEFDGELNDYAKQLKNEKSKKKNDLKRRLEEKKKRKQSELKLKQGREKLHELEAQRQAKALLTSKAEMEREFKILVKLIDSGIVPESQVGEAIEVVLSKRHHTETSQLMAAQYHERTTKIRTVLHELMEAKAKEKKNLLFQFTKKGTNERGRQAAVQDLENQYKKKREEHERQCNIALETSQLRDQRELRERHVAEITSLFKALASDGVLKRIVTTSKQEHLSELQEFREKLEKDTKVRVATMLEELKASGTLLEGECDSELMALDLEFSGYIESAKRDGASRLQAQQEKLLSDKQAELKKAIAASGNDSEKEQRLVLQFDKESSAIKEIMESENSRQDAELISMLGARRHQKRRRKQTETKKLIALKKDEAVKREKMIKEQAAQALQNFRDTQLKHLELLTNGEKDSARTDSFSQAMVGSESLKSVQVENLKNEEGIKEEVTAAKNPVETRTNRLKRQMAQQAATVATATSGGEDAGVKIDVGVASVAIEKKLERIEGLLQRLDPSTAKSSSGNLPQKYQEELQEAILKAYFGTQQDAGRKPDSKLQAVSETDLGPRQRLRLKFGQSLLSVMDMDITSNAEDGVALIAAKSLPGGGGVFKNSMYFDYVKRTLYIRHTRMDNASEFAMILVHSLAHIKVNPKDFSNDADPNFITEFHRLMGKAYQHMFSTSQEALRSTSSSSTENNDTSLKLGPVAETSVPEYFKSANVETRLTELQSFLDKVEAPALLSLSDDDDDDDDDDRVQSARRINSTKSVSSSELYVTNSEQQVLMLQESLDAADKSYMETMKQFNDVSETLEVLKEALEEASTEGRMQDKASLKSQIAEAMSDLKRVSQDRDDMSNRCSKLRKQLENKKMALEQHQKKLQD